MAEVTPRIQEAVSKLQGLPAGAVMTLAKFMAVNVVKRNMQARGLKPAHIERWIIVAEARDYLRDHPELIEHAAETVRKDRKLRTLAERIERQSKANRS